MALLFDMDGTLVDNLPAHMDAWLTFLFEEGIHFTPTAFYEKTGGGMTNAEILRMLFGEHLTSADIGHFTTRKETIYRANYRPAPLAGLHDFLARAKNQGHKLALVTAAGYDNIEFVLEHCDLRDLFDAFVGAPDVVRGKPEPECFLLAASRLGVAPEECLAFEDSPAGLDAVHRAGMQAVAMLTSMTHPKVQTHPAVLRTAADYTTLGDLLK